MGVQETLDQMAGILARLQIPYEARDDGWSYTVHQGVVPISLTAEAWGDATAVHLSAPVVEELDGDEGELAKTYATVNRLNCANYFARFCVYEDRRSVTAEYDLLGD